jgi:hypothetical protein
MCKKEILDEAIAYPKRDKSSVGIGKIKHTVIFTILALIAIIMLIWAVTDQSSEYYTFLRFVIFGISVYGLWGCLKEKLLIEVVVPFFLVIAIIFNPVFPIHFKRLIWQVIDINVAIFIGVIIIFNKYKKIFPLLLFIILLGWIFLGVIILPFLNDKDSFIADIKEVLHAIGFSIGVGLLLIFLYIFGKWVFNRLQIKKKIRLYKKAIRFNPNDANNFYDLGIIYEGMGDYNKAIESYKEAIRIKPEYADVHNKLGYAYEKVFDSKHARESYQEAMRIKPEYALEHYKLGITYAEMGTRGMALDKYKILKHLNNELADKLLNIINGKEDIGNSR